MGHSSRNRDGGKRRIILARKRILRQRFAGDGFRNSRGVIRIAISKPRIDVAKWEQRRPIIQIDCSRRLTDNPVFANLGYSTFDSGRDGTDNRECSFECIVANPDVEFWETAHD